MIEFNSAGGAGTDSGSATMVATGADALTLCAAQSDPLGQMSGDAPSYQVDGPVPQGTPLCTYRDTTTAGITWAVWGANGGLAQTICALASPRSATP